MCDKNCKCDEQVEAVRRKIERIVEDAFDRLETAVMNSKVDIKGQTEVINKKLFDGITKDELVKAIVNENDELDFSGLLSREDVQNAIAECKALRENALEQSFNNVKRIRACEIAINELSQSIMDDVIIFGITADTKLKLASLDSRVSDIINSIK